jgi:exosortase/archaeosortase family protein
MKSENKKIIVALFFFFLFSLYVQHKYEEYRGEKLVPNRFKNDMVLESPTYTPNGLLFLDGFLWISSAHDHTLIKYDIQKKEVVQSFEIPLFEAAGLTFDGTDFWVCDYSKRTIYQISPQGEVINSYQTPYSTPYGITWDGKNLWVLDVYGLEEYPQLFANIYPNSFLYKFDPVTNQVLATVDSPVLFAGDIAYHNGDLIISGCTSRKVFHVDIETGDTDFWYYSPDTFPRAVAAGESNTYWVTGLSTRDLWQVNLDKKAQLKDVRREADVIIPFWLIIIMLLLLLPVALDELTTKEYPVKESTFERVYDFLISQTLSSFLVKWAFVALLVYYISDYLFLRRSTCFITKEFLGFFNVPTVVLSTGEHLFLEGFVMEKSCLSLAFLVVVVGIIWAIRISLKEKILFSLFGFGIMFVWNILRLSIFIVLLRMGVHFLLAHDFFFIAGGTGVSILILKVCSGTSPDMGEELSLLWKQVKEKLISKKGNTT